MREIGLKQADYFHKGFLANFNLQKRIPIVTYFVFFYQNAITETKQVEPLTLMLSTKSAHLLPENSPEAFNGSIVLGTQSSFDGSTLYFNDESLSKLENSYSVKSMSV